MKLIIDIPDNEYQYTCDRTLHDRTMWDNAIRNGIPLDNVRENIHGEWSRHTRVESVYSIDGMKTWGDKCQCNKCTFTTIAVEGFGYYNFCPNCGADMRGET